MKLGLDITPDLAARFLNALLVAIMTLLAQRLPVLRIPELLLVAPMRIDVINHRCRRHPAETFAHHA
jgi:hypothetical protein